AGTTGEALRTAVPAQAEDAGASIGDAQTGPMELRTRHSKRISSGDRSRPEASSAQRVADAGQASRARAEGALRAGSWFVGRSASPWFDASNASCSPRDPAPAR